MAGAFKIATSPAIPVSYMVPVPGNPPRKREVYPRAYTGTPQAHAPHFNFTLTADPTPAEQGAVGGRAIGFETYSALVGPLEGRELTAHVSGSGPMGYGAVQPVGALRASYVQAGKNVQAGKKPPFQRHLAPLLQLPVLARWGAEGEPNSIDVCVGTTTSVYAAAGLEPMREQNTGNWGSWVYVQICEPDGEPCQPRVIGPDFLVGSEATAPGTWNLHATN